MAAHAADVAQGLRSDVVLGDDGRPSRRLLPLTYHTTEHRYLVCLQREITERRTGTTALAPAVLSAWVDFHLDAINMAAEYAAQGFAFAPFLEAVVAPGPPPSPPPSPPPPPPPSPGEPPSPPPSSPPVSALCIDGNWPLFETKAKAITHSPSSSAHTHIIHGQTWYMPNSFPGFQHPGAIHGETCKKK